MQNSSEPILFIFSHGPQIPKFLYYTHIPMMITALVMGVLIYVKSKDKIASKFLLIFLALFFIWGIINIILWGSYHLALGMLLWTIIGPFIIILALFGLFFALTILKSKLIRLPGMLVLSTPFIISLLLSVSGFAYEGFDPGYYYVILYDWYAFYCFFVCFFYAALIVFMLLKSLNKFNPEKRMAIIIPIVGLELFFITFYSFLIVSFSKVASGADVDYTSSPYAMMGMTFFICALAYSITKYEAFGVKLHQTRIIISAILILVGSQIFMFRSIDDQIITGATVIFTGLMGFVLIKVIRSDEENKRRELEKANRELKKLDHAKNDFINLASHQLKTPLTIIKGVASLMVSGKIDQFSKEDKAKFYQSVWNKSLKLEQIVNDILQVAILAEKKESAMNRLAENINLEELIRKILTDFDHQINEKGLTVLINRQSDLVPKIRGQKGYLEEAFINIISNAIKYIPAKKGEANYKGIININLQKDKDKSDRILVVIKDNGIGIPRKDITKIFTRFYRAQNARTLNTDGTGLGLFIVKEIIEGHGGNVKIESNLSQGTSVNVVLPICSQKEPNVEKYIFFQDDKECIKN